MAYNHYQTDNPDPVVQNPAAAMDSVRVNLRASVHAIVMGSGVMPGWDCTIVPGAGTAAAPEYMLYSQGTLAIQLLLTWSAVKLTVAEARYSSDFAGDVGAATWEGVGTLTITYDANHHVTGATWS